MEKISPVKLKAFSLMFVALLLFGITAVSEGARRREAEERQAAAVQLVTEGQGTNAAAQPPPALYTVREHEGAVAVFQAGITSPILSEKVALSALPEEDRQLLRQGVPFESYREMMAFFENYE